MPRIRSLLVVVPLFLACAPPLRAEEPRVGRLHPALRLPTIDGKQTVDLGRLRGRKVLLLQFASW